MSVSHIKEELIHLTSSDRREIEEFLRALAAKEAAETAASADRKMGHDEAMDYVFQGFAPALAKLAQ